MTQQSSTTRSVLVLLLLFVFAASMSGTPPVNAFLSSHTVSAIILKRLLLMLSGVLVIQSWRFASQDRNKLALRGGIAFAASVLVLASIVGYVAYTQIPVRFFTARTSQLLARVWVRGHVGETVLGIGVIAAFFAVGRTRIALVTSGIVMCVLWGATW
jgi:hypothetical protein